jgi:hypothetical protein
MDFIELKLIEKIGNVFSIAMAERKYNRYQFAKMWCLSDTFQSILDFEEWLCSQSKYYIMQVFDEEFAGKLPEVDEGSPLYAEDTYWLGYVLTYWFFLDGTNGKEIIKNYDLDHVLDSYDVLHTVGVKTAIDMIREDDRL